MIRCLFSPRIKEVLVGRLVAVTDTGTGMPPEIMEHVTTSFFTTKPQGQGTGLGLWMVKRFAAACGGKLDIETALGRGTTMRLVFPRDAPAR